MLVELLLSRGSTQGQERGPEKGQGQGQERGQDRGGSLGQGSRDGRDGQGTYLKADEAGDPTPKSSTKSNEFENFFLSGLLQLLPRDGDYSRYEQFLEYVPNRKDENEREEEGERIERTEGQRRDELDRVRRFCSWFLSNRSQVDCTSYNH